jgi:hypothetical protein
MHMKVSHEQFVIDGDRLTPQRHGRVVLDGREKDVVGCDKGAAGKAIFNGNDYDEDELKKTAWELFQLERTKFL